MRERVAVGVVQFFAHVGYYTTQTTPLPKFLDGVLFSSSRTKISERDKYNLYFPVIEDGTDMLSRKVGYKPVSTVQLSARAEIVTEINFSRLL